MDYILVSSRHPVSVDKTQKVVSYKTSDGLMHFIVKKGKMYKKDTIVKQYEEKKKAAAEKAEYELWMKRMIRSQRGVFY